MFQDADRFAELLDCALDVTNKTPAYVTVRGSIPLTDPASLPMALITPIQALTAENVGRDMHFVVAQVMSSAGVLGSIAIVSRIRYGSSSGHIEQEYDMCITGPIAASIQPDYRSASSHDWKAMVTRFARAFDGEAISLIQLYSGFVRKLVDEPGMSTPPTGSFTPLKWKC